MLSKDDDDADAADFAKLIDSNLPDVDEDDD
jgi:hypothetical protein